MDKAVEPQSTCLKKMDSSKLRTRGGPRMTDEDESRKSQQAAKKPPRVITGTTAQQDELTRGGIEVAALALAPSDASLPPSLSPTPPADGRLANFAMVMSGIYRSAWPEAEGYRFLQSLKLKTIVTLVEKDEMDMDYAKLVAENGITQHVFDMKGTKKQAIPPELMRDVLQMVLDTSNHPVLVHCNRGRHRTGCVVGVIRKLYGWDSATAIAEYQSFASPKPRETDINYLTAVEPSELFTDLKKMAKPRRQGSFTLSLAFTFLGLLAWFMTLYRLADVLQDKRTG